MCNAVIRFIELNIHCRQGQGTRRKCFEFVKLNIYCFHTFKNMRAC